MRPLAAPTTRRRRIKRDRKAGEKTLAYFMSKDREGKPTSIKTAARALGVKTTVMAARLSSLVEEGLLFRSSRGVYVGPTTAPTVNRVGAPTLGEVQPTTTQATIAKLKMRREALTAELNRVESAITLLEEIAGDG